jgi:4-hydroxy-tetrahydrodipicolinate synthase
MKTMEYGAFPTMITPYTAAGKVDYDAVEKLVEWYWKEGCEGIFASCQSSEIWFLPEDDRVKLAKVVKDTADRLAREDKSRPPMTIVASGHTSDNREDQIRELTRVAETGVDAVILITNRMDIANTDDETWIRETKALVDALPDVPLGLYECPLPYKRLLTPAMLRYCVESGRFRFIKDTCCDADEIERRMKILRGTDLLLYNANAQTLLSSLRAGAAGYCGVMCNFHPRLYAWLGKHYESEQADLVQAVTGTFGFTEGGLPYPLTAKYHMNLCGLKTENLARNRKSEELTDYARSCMKQMKLATDALEKTLGME